MRKIIFAAPFLTLTACNTTETTIINAETDSSAVSTIQTPYLVCIRNADFEPAYLNEKGDTVIPFGKYIAAQTDTITALGIVQTPDFRWIGIDQSEKELVEFFIYDNGPDYFEEGLARIQKDGKIGFVNEAGEIVIEPQFAFADPFENGKARATNSGVKKTEGEHWFWDSKDWFYIDTTGKKVEN